MTATNEEESETKLMLETREDANANIVPDRVINGERLFWIVVGILGLIFLLYFIGAYRFAEPARRNMREDRSRYFGRGLQNM